MQRTAKLEMRDVGEIDWQNDRIKIWYRLRMPDGGRVEWPLGVFYMPTAPKRYSGVHAIRSLECYDLSTVLQSDAIIRRLYYPAGTKYVDIITALLRSAGVDKVMIRDGEDILRTARDWDPYTPKIDIINTLLGEINYTPLSVDGNGIFRSKPYVPDIARLYDYKYESNELSVIREGGTSQFDAFNVPNVFFAVVSNPDEEEMHVLHENNDPAHPLSIPNRRGRRVVQKLEFEGIASPNVLEEAVLRAADESMRGYETLSISTALMPHHEAEDCLWISCRLGEGRYIEQSWSMTLASGGAMTHNLQRLVSY